jgi:hypothetical protein
VGVGPVYSVESSCWSEIGSGGGGDCNVGGSKGRREGKAREYLRGDIRSALGWRYGEREPFAR